MIHRVAERVLAFAVVVVVLSLILGAVFGQPVLFSYVTSDSMSPTLNSGDGFIAIPTQATDSPEVGDVIIFKATEVGGGGLATHRIIGQTEEGFVTRGDGNPVTDQDSGEPPVKSEQVVAKALRVGGSLVVIPGLGVIPEKTKTALSYVQSALANALRYRILRGPQGVGYLIFAATVVWYVTGAVRDRKRRDESRMPTRKKGVDGGFVVGIAVGVLLIAATAGMTVPSGPHEYTFVSADFDSDQKTVIQRGESATLTYSIGNAGLLPVVSFFNPSSESVDVQPKEIEIPARTTVNASVTIHAPQETGRYRRYITEHRYLAVLPQSTIRALYEVHPWAPIVVIDALIAIPFYTIGVRLAGRARIRRNRSRESSQSIVTRVRGFVTDLY